MAEPVEILLADGSDVGRHVIATTLRRSGFDVREVPDGIEALREVLRRPPDLAVLAVKMPGLSGLEVCSRMKANPATALVPVLLLSSIVPDDASRVQGLEMGADGYLTQPMEPPVLIASIHSLLRTRAAERAERLAATEWRVTFDAIGDAVALLDAGGRISRCNQAFAGVAGVQRDAAVGRRIVELVPELGGLTDGGGSMGPGADGRGVGVGVDGGAPEEEPTVAIGGREFTCRVHDLTDPESISQAVLTLRDVTAERELGRAREEALRREHLISTTLQEALAPGRLPAIGGLALSAKYVLGQADVVVGGDWFDVIPTPDGVWLTVGDNAGHGVVATARAVQLRNNLRLLADEGYRPAEALSRLGAALGSAAQVELASAMIVALGWDGRSHVVCAGHPPALLLRPGSQTLLIGEAGGPVLGYPDAHYLPRELSLQLGDAIVLYTDGLIERRDESIDVGLARLIAAAAEVAPADLPEHAFALLLPERPIDDAAILVAEITGVR